MSAEPLLESASDFGGSEALGTPQSAASRGRRLGSGDTGSPLTRAMSGASIGTTKPQRTVGFSDCGAADLDELDAGGDAATVLRALGRFIGSRQIMVTLRGLFGSWDGDRELSADEIRSCMWNSGLVARAKDVDALIGALSSEGLGIRGASVDQLASAIELLRSGREDWAERCRRVPRLNLQDEAPEEVGAGAAGSTRIHAASGWPGEVLSAVQEHLDVEHIRIAELFRSSWYNRRHREEVLDWRALQGMLEKAGFEISDDDAKYTASFLSPNGNGFITIDTLTQALRANRRGHQWHDVQEWRARSPSPSVGFGLGLGSPGSGGSRPASGRGSPATATPGSPGSSRSFDISDRVFDLHSMHQAKLRKFKAQKEMQEAREFQQLEDAKSAARLGSRAVRRSEESLSPSPEEVVNRLVEAGEHREKRLQALRTRFAEQELQDLEESRLGPTPLAQKQRARSPSKDTCRRLHEQHSERAAKKGEKQRSELLSQERECDIVGQRALERSPPTKAAQEELAGRLLKFADARDKRREKMQNRALEAEEKVRRESSPRRRLDEEHLHRLHSEHGARQAKWKKELEAQAAAQEQRLKLEAEAAISKTAVSKAAAGPKYNSAAETEKFHARHRTEETRREVQSRSSCKSSIGFSSFVPPPREPSPHLLMADAGDVVLASVNAAVSLRCGCTPEDASPKALQDLFGVVKEVLDKYKRAQKVSDGQPGGAGALREMRSQRLYASGYLMQDVRGQAKLLEPDPIRQLDEDLVSLLRAAERAQELLVQAIGPQQQQPPQSSSPRSSPSRPWRPGEKFPTPNNVRSAIFAYNPGVKSKAAAERKAFVRFAPATREKRYSHLLDLARVGLVFKNSIQLLLALRDIHSAFEVVQVRNFYCPGMQNHLGERWVEVSVVLSEGLEMPHVCEIRLEEESFFEVRMQTAAPMQTLARGFSEMYMQTTEGSVREDAVQYLVHWALRRPRDTPALGRFRRKLAGKFRSSLNAWRRAFRSSPLLNFHDFRTVTMLLQCQRSVVEYWEALDCTRCGQISIMELDAEAVMLCARLRARLIAFFEREDGAEDSEAVVAKLACLASVRLKEPGKVASTEFRAIAKLVGFCPSDADHLFAHLDSTSGFGPGHIVPGDFDWLMRLPRLIDLQALALARDEAQLLAHDKAKVQLDRSFIPRPQFCRRPSFLNPVEAARGGTRSLSPPSHRALIPALPRRSAFSPPPYLHRSSAASSRRSAGSIGASAAHSMAASSAPPPRRVMSVFQKANAITAVITAIEGEEKRHKETSLGRLLEKDRPSSPPREALGPREARSPSPSSPPAARSPSPPPIRGAEEHTKKKQRPEVPPPSVSSSPSPAPPQKKCTVPKLALGEALARQGTSSAPSGGATGGDLGLSAQKADGAPQAAGSPEQAKAEAAPAAKSPAAPGAPPSPSKVPGSPSSTAPSSGTRGIIKKSGSMSSSSSKKVLVLADEGVEGLSDEDEQEEEEAEEEMEEEYEDSEADSQIVEKRKMLNDELTDCF